ncbi:sugar phosphate isomerase/epimerase [Novosphingobium sp. YJ-S2-02]|uniref:Sugar phosphate isomerase/epimerase n=1 Tax=Novosphingobium aureum TaxID=2792964 RepID=A0A931HFF8_9SPHN|nr:sugar phosphate isomerase/epimerase [Novosphingobium aureum]MBH0114418.1 sugar phosphate isomerase/epimerase [Novosphingobium aureum]
MTTSRRQLLGTGAALAGAAMLPGFAASALDSSAPFLAAKGLPLGMQLYTVGAAASEDLAGTFARLAGMGYRTIELAGYHGHSPAQLREAADAAGLTFTSIHLSDQLIGRSDEDARRIAADLAVLGIRNVVLPTFIWPSDIARRDGEVMQDWLARAVAVKGRALWQDTASLLNARGKALKAEGLRLAYHNHNAEFGPVDGTSGWQIILDETDPALVDFEVDAGWVAAAGIDPVAFVSGLKGRVRQMHVKDIKASTVPNFAFRQDPAEVGLGKIDWPRLLPAAYAAGVRHFYVEQEPPFTTGRFESLAISAENFSTMR